MPNQGDKRRIGPCAAGNTPSDPPPGRPASNASASGTAPAHRWLPPGVIPTNPTSTVTPLQRPEGREPRVLSPAQARALLAVAREAGPQPLALARLALTTGLALRYIVALHWDDVAWSEAALHVRQRLREDGGAPRLLALPPGERRTLYVDAGTLACLQNLHAVTERPPSGSGVDPLRGLHVFARPNGSPLRAATARRQLASLCRRAGLPPMTPRELRYTATTLIVLAGMPLPMIVHRLGHRSYRLVAVSLLASAQVEARGRWHLDSLDRLLEGGATGDAEYCHEAS